jgi:hypothetical protein
MSGILLKQLVLPFFLWFFFVFGLISLAVGMGVLLKPEPTRRLSEIMNRWVSTRRGLKWLEVPRSEEGLLDRFRRPFGALAIPILAYSTFVLITLGDMRSFVDALRLGNNSNAVLVLIVMDTVRWCLIVFGLAAIVASVMLIFFPNALKTVKMPADHWFSIRSLLAGGDDMRMGLDTWVLGRPRAMGGLILVGAVVVVFSFGLMLFK